VDNQAVFFYISGTIIVEFLLETLPQILIQVINNSKWFLYRKNLLDVTDSELSSGSGSEMLGDLAEDRHPIGSGWSGFTIVSVLISFIVAFDGIYRQLVKVFCMGYKFGSHDMWLKKDKKGQKDVNTDSMANSGRMSRDDGDRLNGLRTDRKAKLAIKLQVEQQRNQNRSPLFAHAMNKPVAETNLGYAPQSIPAPVPREYTALLKMALADGIIQAEEEVQLDQMRKESGISDEQHDVAVRAIKAAPGFVHVDGAKVCEKCNAKVQFCTCDPHRNTVDYRNTAEMQGITGGAEAARGEKVLELPGSIATDSAQPDVETNVESASQNEPAPPVPIPREYAVGVEMALADGIIQIEEEEMLAKMRKQKGVTVEQHAVAIQAIEAGEEYVQIDDTQEAGGRFQRKLSVSLGGSKGGGTSA
jgi:hypothetical protein